MDQNKKTKNRPWWSEIIRWAWMLFFAGLALGTGFFYALANGWVWELPSFEELENPKTYLASEIITSDGQLLGKYFRENRTNVIREQIPDEIVAALIATEDERFYDHSGIDIRRLVTAVLALGTRGGASTLSQQLAKQLYHEPAGSVMGRLKQKLMEWVISVQLERSYTKDEIITMYLNKFDFIHNARGIESAAQVYFNTKVSDLKMHQGALLVGMLKNPSLYNPMRKDTTRAFNRRNTVFGQMLRNGVITKEQNDSLDALPMDLDYQRVSHNTGSAPYFREMLRAELKRMFSEKDEDGNYILHKPDSAHSPYDIYRDGLKIYTTIDSRMQRYGEKAVSTHLGQELQADFDNNNKKWRNPPFSNDLKEDQINRILKRSMKQSARYAYMAGIECPNCHRRGDFVNREEIDGEAVWKCSADDCEHMHPFSDEKDIEKAFAEPTEMTIFSWQGDIDTTLTPMDSIRYYKAVLQAGLMSMDPHTGEIRAWVGGIDHKYFAYDHVKQGKRQVGSTFKPFVYALAIENGISPCYQVPNIQTRFNKGEYGLLKDWAPKNSDTNCTGEMVSLRYGLGNSLNTITAWVMKQYGPAASIEYARRMGITSRLDTVPSLALGVADISLYEMVGANATFANQGVWQKPIFITRIEDKHGNLIKQFIPDSREAMSEENAYVMLELMKGVTMGTKDCTGRKRGTAIRLHLNRPYGNIPWDRPIAGKTGTTQNNSDGWFMGITPDLVTGVWVGAENRSVRFRSTYYGQGANTALPIWGYYMKDVWSDEELTISKGDFKKPDFLDAELNCDQSAINSFDNFDSEEPNFDF